MSGTEPPSGITGAGTIDRPYDGGNAPEQASATNAEPLSGVTGKGTINQPYDQGNQMEQPAASNPRRQTGSSLPSSVAAILKRNPNGNGYASASASGTATPNVQQSIEKEQVEQSTPTTTKPAPAAPTGYFDASKKKDRDDERQRYEERDVSPGEMRDGSHVQTSGDKGENYTPGKLNKFKDKFGFGHGR